MSVLIGLFLVTTMAYAAPQDKPAVKCTKGFVAGISRSECLGICSEQYDNCVDDCREFPEDSKYRASCWRRCARWYQDCKRTCPQARLFDKEQRSEGTIMVAGCTQLPKPCSSNSDCECSGCCAQLGEGGPHVCQPSC